MRRALSKRSPEGNRLLVGEVPPPVDVVALVLALAQFFVEAYQRLHARMLDYAERFLSRDDACDAVADAIAGLWVRWPSLSQEKRTDQYIFGAVCHSVSAKRRQNRRRVSLDDVEVEYELDQRAVSAVREGSRRDTIADVLDAALAALTPRRREVLLLVKEQGFTYQEAAQALGLKYETIHTHVRLAIEDVRAAFARAGFRIAGPRSRQQQLPAPKGGNTND